MKVGDAKPVPIMYALNLSPDSFYRASIPSGYKWGVTGVERR